MITLAPPDIFETKLISSKYITNVIKNFKFLKISLIFFFVNLEILLIVAIQWLNAYNFEN